MSLAELSTVSSPERLRVYPEEDAGHRRTGRVRSKAALVAVDLVLLAVGIASALLFAIPGTPPVTSDPAPASTLSTAEAFAPTRDLISDPFVLPTPQLDYMYSSGPGGVGQPHLPERTFTVLGQFLSLNDAMPTLPSWVEPNTGLWAPDVRHVGRNYVMWFTGKDRDDMLPTGAPAECIGLATSASPTGPFTSRSSTPAICQTSQYGDIDPRTLTTANGQQWLYWKNDGNADNSFPTRIYAQRLAADGQTRIGATSVLLANDLPWEGHLIEAPDMVQVGHRYLLFFAGNASWADDSGIGLALCKGPGGPCSSPYAGPWLGSNVQGAGPGEETVYSQNGITWMLYTPHGLYYFLALPELAAARIAFTPTGLPYVADRQGMVPGVTAGLNGQVGQR
ncbi:MAG TPA: family 43 glycosylhydrolase [Acidimicrobiales bacterium]